ncbi:cytochrome b [Candidatus Thiothrix sp. Deng01]|uniref:Cytochrome b n=1 Tax=Candidatus Thiothrix phosphatis TaxID=3112415 RepID=A0ABU6CZB5_9GAMM|nr:cytochrome b [Candidatus Thiothrix sp. Deng01]MEB4592180.1 cytochrome b [Candidatus Thiothrix sp. Deng01]
MQARNTTQAYGWVSILLHWVMAIALIGMYVIGDYMVDLDYYDDLYHKLPALHKSTGVILAGLLLVRLAWLHSQPRPAASGGAPAFTHLAGKLGHLALYALLFTLIISGYLISTAEAHGVSVFGWFELPALLPASKERADLAGNIHEIAANLFIFLVGVHALAAFIHHFYWKDNTLTRMLGRG